MDDNKKPGQRDISDLKARLGLKKTAAMPAVTPAGTPPGGAPVPAPLPSQSAPQPSSGQGLPSPFGQPAPQPAPAPAPAAPPDPRRDPFAQQQAANLAAFYGVGQVLPGSADLGDSKPLEKPKPWGTIAVFLIAGAAMFGVGSACGAVYKQRAEFNNTIDHATQIRDEVDKLSKQLNSIADTLNASKLTAKGDVDFDMSKKLGDLDLKKPDQQKIFHTNYYNLEDIVIERLFTYYDHTIRLYDELTVHAKKTDADKESIESYQKNGAGKGDKTYGVTIDASQALAVGHFVEVGTPVCNTEGKTDCPASELKGFKYRTDSGAPWGERPVKGKMGEIVVPLQPTPLFKSVAAGNPDILAYKDYLRRIVSIKQLAQGLIAEQKEVLADLKRAADRPKVFTF